MNKKSKAKIVDKAVGLEEQRDQNKTASYNNESQKQQLNSREDAVMMAVLKLIKNIHYV